MTPRASPDRLRSIRGPLWTIDVASGQILDWNDEASRLCGWGQRATKRAFDDLSRLLSIDSASIPRPVTMREIVRLSTAAPGDGLLEAQLRQPDGDTHALALEGLGLGFHHHATTILLIGTRRRHGPAETPGMKTLAATVGHELNNISVPLYGFMELAAQRPMREESVRLCLAEVRIAAGRVRAVASDLESLAEAESRRAPVLIERCLSTADGVHPTFADVDWHCRTDILVSVNQLQARRAVQALTRIGVRDGSPLKASVSVLPKNASASTRCVVCHSLMAHTDGYVIVQVHGVRPVSAAALRDPFGSERAGGSTRRLNLAVLVHCGHLAGGHLLFDKASDSISLAFSQA